MATGLNGFAAGHKRLHRARSLASAWYERIAYYLHVEEHRFAVCHRSKRWHA
jgi:hypothetical protein